MRFLILAFDASTGAPRLPSCSGRFGSKEPGRREEDGNGTAFRALVCLSAALLPIVSRIASDLRWGKRRPRDGISRVTGNACLTADAEASRLKPKAVGPSRLIPTVSLRERQDGSL